MRILALIMALTFAQILEERIACAELARHDLIEFARLSTPAPHDRINSRLSRYQWVRHHRVIADALERVAAGEIDRLEIELPPRHGKSELAVREFIPFFMGQHPEKSAIVLCHTDTLATDHGRDVRDYWEGPGFSTVFGHKPEAALRTDSRAADRLQSVAGGIVTFSGRSGLGAGVGGHLLIVDDLFKNSEEAASPATRDSAWRGYNNDAKTRLNDEHCPIVMIGSRRNEDDVQGRIFDKTSIHYDAAEAARWTRIRIPALAEDLVDALGRKVDEPIWPEKFGFKYFDSMRSNASEIIRDDFQTQYQCNPRPQEGTWFKKDWLKTYRPTDLPKQLRFYVSSDHAIRIKEKNDSSCLLSAGIDPTGDVYILPNTIWKKLAPDQLVDAMFVLAKQQRIAMWWAARDAISGSLEPFIRKRMNDERIFFPLDDSITENRDLVQRSSSIRGLMAMGKVHWPIEWPLWSAAENQLLSFPGKHDDIVAALAILGMGMDRMVKAEGSNKSNIPERGTYAWHSFGKQDGKSKNSWA
jgi:phage terminase large subunit-like protein